MTDPSTPASSYLHAEPITAVEILEVPEVHTVVAVFADHPMSEMAAAFDTTFREIFAALQTHDVTPTGPAFSLHHRPPAETATFEVGIPVDRPLRDVFPTNSGVTLVPSTLPAGEVARVSHLGAYAGLGEAWGRLLENVGQLRRRPGLPFWEVYVTEPSPDTDPATLRTDLYTRVDEAETPA